MGPAGFEPATSRLSAGCSSQTKLRAPPSAILPTFEPFRPVDQSLRLRPGQSAQPTRGSPDRSRGRGQPDGVYPKLSPPARATRGTNERRSSVLPI
jgi:hypothetical protein